MSQKPHRKSIVPSSAKVEAKSALSALQIGKSGLIAGAAVATLAAAAVVNRFVAKRAEAKTPPAGKFVEVDGVRLHYVDR